ncbi:MAG: putative sporulation protein YtxC [Clostridium sp.]|nr:putative sporulation protein YtxC [Clostridium sp.]
MLLKSIIYDGDNEDVMNGIDKMVNNMALKGIKIGIAESEENSTHLVKIFCDDDEYKKRINTDINLYISMIIYRLMAKKFFFERLENFIDDTYFFLKGSEVNEIKEICMKTLLSEIKISDENTVFYVNRKNTIMKRIYKFIIENENINVQGSVTFRINEMEDEFKSIVDKIIENYMVQREYGEFIKLLKYFVEFQECKIDEIHIYSTSTGEFIIKDSSGNDLMDRINSELKDIKYKNESDVNVDDTIISGLITLVPKKIIIHCRKNFKNAELLKTIESVFEGRIEYCEMCNSCKISKEHLIKN